MAESEPAGQDSVGSLAQETARLLHVLAAEARRPTGEDTESAAGDHVCTTSWCPICQVVGYVHDHPEVVEQVTDAAVQFGRTVRDVLERTLPPTSTDEA
ncbi:MAG: hypothetical protein ACR2FE_04315 [Aeromicrobium sp.]